MYNLIKKYLVVVDSPKVKITDDEIKKLRREDEEREQGMILKARKEAEGIIKKARETAEKIIKEAEKRAENMKKEISNVREMEMKKLNVMKKRLEDEMKEKMKDMEREYMNRLELLEKIVEEFKKREEDLILESLSMILRFSKGFFKKMLLKIDDETVKRRLEYITGQIKDGRKINIKLSVEDERNVDEKLIDGLKGEFEDVSITFDGSLKKGDVVVETDFGNLDLTFEDGSEILEELLGELDDGKG